MRASPWKLSDRFTGSTATRRRAWCSSMTSTSTEGEWFSRSLLEGEDKFRTWECDGGRVITQEHFISLMSDVFSYNRNIKMQNLWEYTSMRKRLLSKRVYLLASVCQDKLSEKKKSPTGNLFWFIYLSTYLAFVSRSPSMMSSIQPWASLLHVDYFAVIIISFTFATDLYETGRVCHCISINLHLYKGGPLRAWTLFRREKKHVKTLKQRN